MDEATRRDIDRIASRILADAGVTVPPVPLDKIISLLRIDHSFYSLDDPGLIRHFWHKAKVGVHKLVEVAEKVRLHALWIPEGSRILVDSSLPQMKQKWASFHDLTHSVLPWHREYFFGDTAQTLDPDYQEMLEAEANYGASAIMFCEPLFSQEALDTSPEWRSIDQLKKRYKTSWVTTLRRYVEHTHQKAMAMLVSTPFWKPKPPDQAHRWRNFAASQKFHRDFMAVTPEDVLAKVDGNIVMRHGGPVADFQTCLMDDNGVPNEFHVECFFNQYHILTFLVHQKPLTANSVVLA